MSESSTRGAFLQFQPFDMKILKTICWQSKRTFLLLYSCFFSKGYRVSNASSLHFCFYVGSICSGIVVLKQQDLLKISWIILSYPLADCFEFRACLPGRRLCSQTINKYSNNPTKVYKRKIRRFLGMRGFFFLQRLNITREVVPYV